MFYSFWACSRRKMSMIFCSSLKSLSLSFIASSNDNFILWNFFLHHPGVSTGSKAVSGMAYLKDRYVLLEGGSVAPDAKAS
jgi:hypothetical protein